MNQLNFVNKYKSCSIYVRHSTCYLRCTGTNHWILVQGGDDAHPWSDNALWGDADSPLSEPKGSWLSGNKRVVQVLKPLKHPCTHHHPVLIIAIVNRHITLIARQFSELFVVIKFLQQQTMTPKTSSKGKRTWISTSSIEWSTDHDLKDLFSIYVFLQLMLHN